MSVNLFHECDASGKCVICQTQVRCFCSQLVRKVSDFILRSLSLFLRRIKWPAPGSEDTELGVLMEPEVGHGETEVYARVQA